MAGHDSPRLRFPREARLKASRDFQRVRQSGRRLSKGCLILNWLVLPEGGVTRAGFVTSRKIGNSVARSRARRLLREAFRLHQHDLTGPVELVLVARASIGEKDFAGVERDYLAGLAQAALLQTTT